MSEQEQAEEPSLLPKDFDIRVLGAAELNKLSDQQMEYVRNEALTRRNPRVHAAVMKVMKDQSQKIVEALASEPYSYVTPDIELHPKLKVTFRSLYTLQTEDIAKTTNDYIRNTRASDFMGATYMNKLFAMHGVNTVNGMYPGGVEMKDDLPNLESDKAEEAVRLFREKRMRAFNVMPAAMVQLIISANQVFQELYDNVVNLRGPDAEEKATKLVEAVGKSTAPLVAGQKPT